MASQNPFVAVNELLLDGMKPDANTTPKKLNEHMLNNFEKMSKEKKEVLARLTTDIFAQISDNELDEEIKDGKENEDESSKKLFKRMCEEFPKLGSYKDYKEKGRKNYEKLCCSVAEVGCPFYKTTWFMFTCIGVGVLIIVIIIVVVVLVVLRKKKRGGGGKDAIEESKKEGGEENEN